MENISLDIENNAQKILPVPYSKPPVPSVPSSNNYGSSPYPLPLKPSPNRKNDQLQYCNFIEPSPRDQRLNVPYEGNKDCPNFMGQPYNKDSCYLLDSKAQGVVGIVCNQAGGSDNADFYRGNQFGVDYPLNQNLEGKKIEYNTKEPVQLPLELQNPTIIYDKDTFYPQPSFPLRNNPNFITYPLQQNYTSNGMPTYTYPYKTLNPIFNDPTQKVDIEYFDNQGNTDKPNSTFFILFFLIFLFLFIMKFI
jgi:hypothetical protein